MESIDLVETGLTDPVTSAAATAVFLGNGDGTFKPPIYYDMADIQAQWPASQLTT